MKAKITGIQEVDYVSRKSGNPVKGVTLHCTFKDPQVKGEAADGIFVSDNLGLDFVHSLVPGDIVDIFYNNRGYVSDVQLISSNVPSK